KGQGLVGFDPVTESYRQYLPDPDRDSSLPVETVWDIWEDERGGLWLASWGGGLVRFDPAKESFDTYTTEDGIGLTSNHLYTIYPDPTDAKILWLGTAEGGLVRFDRGTQTAKAFRHDPKNPATLGSDDVLSIH